MKVIACLALIFNLFISSNANQMPTLLVKFPTRERPERFFKCLDLYYENLSYNIPYYFLITCDEDDSTMNRSEVIKRLEEYPNLQVIFGKSNSKIDACNRDMELAPYFDILILISDDMVPVIYKWDERIVQDMISYFPKFDGILKYNDRPDAVVMLNTLPIMGINYYKKLGYIYHPLYKSFFCDLEMTLVSKILRKEAIFNSMIIRHDHPDYGDTPLDNLYVKNFEAYFDDRNLFMKRAKNNFELDEVPLNVSVIINEVIQSLS